MPERPSKRGKVFRDPVHDVINWKDDAQDGVLISALIDSAELQRLRHIRQLGMAGFVFHGAEHSRFTHSLGVAHIARRICDRVAARISPEERTVAVAGALLHDIGHAPFSHVMERVFDFDHEAYSAMIVRDASSRVHKTLADHDRALPELVASLMTGEREHVTRGILSGQLDADRADYLLRDAYMTGVPVGLFDLERILLMIDIDDDGLLVGRGGFESVEGYVMARYHMYRLVYFHRAVRCAETMVERMFSRARHLMEEGEPGVAPPNALGALMRGEEVSPAAYATLGDYDAWSTIAAWRDHRDPVLALMARGLLERSLFKSNERTDAPGDAAEDHALEEEILEALSPNERFLFHIDVAADHPYRPYAPRLGQIEHAVRIRDHDGRVTMLEDQSSVVRALAESSYRMRRWCYHPSIRGKLRAIAGDRWLVGTSAR